MPVSVSMNVSGGNGTVDVRSADNCAWVAVSTAFWITLNGSTEGNGNGTLRYSVAPSSRAASRTGMILVGGQQFTVVQEGLVPPLPAVGLLPSIGNASSVVGNSKYMYVAADAVGL